MIRKKSSLRGGLSFRQASLIISLHLLAGEMEMDQMWLGVFLQVPRSLGPCKLKPRMGNLGFEASTISTLIIVPF